MAATYALDITNKRVQNALAVLGIEESELEIKYFPLRTLEDFAGPRVSEDIQSLRYDYYTRKLQETKRKIKYQIREDRQRQVNTGESVSVKALRTPQTVSRDFAKSVSLANFLDIEARKLSEAKEKHRKSIIRTLQQSKQTTPKTLSKSADEESPLKEALIKRHEELEKRRQRHEAKLEEIQKRKEKRQKELLQTMSKSMREHEERGRKLEEEKKMILQERTRSFQEKQQEIMRRICEREEQADGELQSRLAQIEEKIDKNRQLHQHALRQKSEKAAKIIEKADNKTCKFGDMRSSQEVERIKQYITAQQQARERKQELTSEQMAKFEEMRKKADAKIAKIKELQTKEKQQENSNIRRLEKKMKTASMVLERKQRDWAKELELRLEEERLKDEDKRTKVERAQRRFVRSTQNLKRTKLMDKLMQEKDKAEQLRREQFLKETRHQETAIKIMIDKEKATEVQSLVSKSPLSRVTQDKLKTLEIKVEVESEEKAEKEVLPAT